MGSERFREVVLNVTTFVRLVYCSAMRGVEKSLHFIGSCWNVIGSSDRDLWECRWSLFEHEQTSRAMAATVSRVPEKGMSGSVTFVLFIQKIMRLGNS